MKKNVMAVAFVPRPVTKVPIGMVNGKAKLLRDDYCDGLGDCLPACPAGAISFNRREAAAYDEAAVLENKEEKGSSGPSGSCRRMSWHPVCAR